LEESRSLILDLLMISWGVITAFLVVLVVYRGTLSSKEDDQIFIDAAEQHHYQEQQAIIARMSRLTRPIIGRFRSAVAGERGGMDLSGLQKLLVLARLC
jgi:hypothetical protein